MARLEAYLDAVTAAGDALPMRNGKPNLSAIAIACGFDRQVLYKNPGAVSLLAAFFERQPSTASTSSNPDDPEDDQKPVHDRKDRRIQQLEQQLSAVRAENVALREKLRRLQHLEDYMVETGRRVVSFGPSLEKTGKP
ncbi:hypothetical protein [Aureimonas sp. SK2]|uniref:hypothetical protein n=1 Tax=Aureimonas sp. SK2 TaxID=3015992 RepID=UPI002444DA3F|nr:hypothetical protein [Aureimonas sp. SK2]